VAPPVEDHVKDHERHRDEQDRDGRVIIAELDDSVHRHRIVVGRFSCTLRQSQ
jgi:hypothetical protein